MRYTWKKSGFSLLMLASVILIISGFQGCKKDPKVTGEPFVRWQENESVQSKIYNHPVNYSVLLPENYNSSTDSFPVVYLLHGYGDDQSSWYKYGLIKYYSDLGVVENGPMIFVMPQGYNSYYVNRYNGGVKYMDFFTTELVPHVDSVYRTKKDKAHRAVMGYSMGGYGALILPSKNPDIFQTGVALSMSFRTDSQYIAEPQWVFDSQWGPIFGGTGAEGNARLTDYFLANSPFHFFSDQGGQSFTGLNLYIDCGDDEETLSETNGSLHNVLRDLNIPHEYRMNNGGHSWDYWHKELPEALRYIGFAFQQIPYPDGPDPVDPGPAIPSNQIHAEQLTDTGLSFNIILPSIYDEGAGYYPVIIVLHDRDAESQDEESQKLYSLLTKNISNGKLPNCVIIEIPIQPEAITVELMHALLDTVSLDYRIIDQKDFTVLVGNKQGGLGVYQLMTGCSDICNTFLFFDADLPDDASDVVTDASFYLDICEQGIGYKGYHSLYMSLRKNQLNPEYRVRQGTPSHEVFLNGLDKASGFINDHLNN
jgi:S-formylglutathione hydrolase FrmB